MKRLKPLQLGFIGGGINSAIGTTHKIASMMDGRWQLVSGCFSEVDSINRQTASLWGTSEDRTYRSWNSFLKTEKGKIDAVVVLTPTPTHAEIVMETLKQGVPVICEKALATSTSESQKIKRVVKATRGFLAVTFNYTGYPMIRELQHRIQKGALGKVNQIQVEMPQDGYVRLGKGDQKPSPQTWRLKDYTVPTLSLDLGVHVHHLIDFLSGEKPKDVVSLNGHFGLFKDIVDTTMCLATYTHDVQCQIWFTKTALGHSNGLRIRVYGTQGSAHWFQMQPEILQLADNRGHVYSLERSSASATLANQARYNRFKAGHPAGFIEAFANLYSDLADGLMDYKRNGRITSPWIFGVDVAHEGLAMLEAMARSTKHKSWEPVKHP